MALAERLFEGLQKLHGMSPRWLTYLKLAVLFRNSGRLISTVEHQVHSYYIVKHAEPAGLRRVGKGMCRAALSPSQGWKVQSVVVALSGSEVFEAEEAVSATSCALENCRRVGPRAPQTSLGEIDSNS